MKRFFVLLTAALLLCTIAFAQNGQVTTTEDVRSGSVIIWRNHLEMTGEHQDIVVDYPTFESDDPAFADYVQTMITEPIQKMYELEELADARIYADGNKDEIRGGYMASVDFPGLLSVEASVRAKPAGSQQEQLDFFWCIFDMKQRRSVQIAELFEEPAAVVDEAICSAVYKQASELGAVKDTITSGGQVPLPDSYYLTRDALRVLYDADTLYATAIVLDLAWDQLPLTPSELLKREESAVTAAPTLTPAVTLAPETIAIIGGADGPTAIYIAPDAQDVPDEVKAMLTASPIPTVTPFPQQTFAPDFSLAPVVTPTPMPVEGNDAVLVDVLTHGLWKPLGSEGNTYYQFTADGMLLTVTVSGYTVKDGVLTSDVLSGTLDVGSDSAFTLNTNGYLTGYVLNRQGERVAPEEFVTPSPTPVPTPTPSPTPTPTPIPTPTPSPTPTPTPKPTPTLSPYEQAVMQAPEIVALPEAEFEKARTLQVYAAPGEHTWNASGAQVTTDESVTIYGSENGWLLVSYAIGNGSRGRMGYIEDWASIGAQNVTPLSFISMPIKLTRNAEATDDPLRGQETLMTIKAGTQVTLKAFMGEKWAYVETTLEGKLCRVFIPRSALMD